MSIPKSKKILEHVRNFLDKYSTEQNYGDLIQLGSIEETDSLGSALHKETLNGNRRALKKVLHSSICVDYPNDKGQSPLFCACTRNVENTALLLLQHGANPNEKSFDGLTPTHAACYVGNVRLLGKLIEAGADLRLHDIDGRSVRAWAKLNPDPSARGRMVDFLDRTHVYAMTFSGDAVNLDKFTKYPHRPHKKTSLMEIMKLKTGSETSFDNLKRVHSMGFGKVYLGNDHAGGIISVIPMISETLLYLVDGTRFETGPMTFMERMTWMKTTVTVKQANPDVQQNDGIDLLITEAEFLGKLRHPNVLLLMAICQSINFDSLMLVFEHVRNGNLYYFLHVKGNRFTYPQQMAVVFQLCSAMEFIHSQSLIHCGLSSMAVYLVNENYIKVANFEFMVESIKANLGRISLVSTVPHGQQLYNWMAPEVMMGNAPWFASDVYSFCCIVWELFSGELPWQGNRPETIKHKVLELNRPLNVNLGRLPLKLKSLVSYGLVLRRDERLQKFTNILEWLSPDPGVSESRSKIKNKSGNFSTYSQHSSSSCSSANDDSKADWTMDNLCIATGIECLNTGQTGRMTSPYQSGPTVTDSESGPSNLLTLDPNSQCNDISFEEVGDSPAKLNHGIKVKPASHMCSVSRNHCVGSSLHIGSGGQHIGTLPQAVQSNLHQIRQSPISLDETETSIPNTHHLRQAILKGSMAPKGSTEAYLHSLCDDTMLVSHDKLMKDVTSSLVDFGDLSCTPVAKFSSTPIEVDRKLDIVPSLGLNHMDASNECRNICRRTISDSDREDSQPGARLGLLKKTRSSVRMIEDTSNHQAFLDEIMIVHSQIVSRSSLDSPSGADYQSPVIQVCQKVDSDSGVGPSCLRPEVLAIQQPDDTNIIEGDLAVSSLTYGPLDDSFWGLLLAGEKCQRVGSEAYHSPPLSQCAQGSINHSQTDQRSNSSDKAQITQKGEITSVASNVVNETFACRFSSNKMVPADWSWISTENTHDIESLLIINNVGKLPSCDIEEKNKDLNQKVDGQEFEFLDNYIDDDFGYALKTSVAISEHGGSGETTIGITEHDSRGETDIAICEHGGSGETDIAICEHGGSGEAAIAICEHGGSGEAAIAICEHGGSGEAAISINEIVKVDDSVMSDIIDNADIVAPNLDGSGEIVVVENVKTPNVRNEQKKPKLPQDMQNFSSFQHLLEKPPSGSSRCHSTQENLSQSAIPERDKLKNILPTGSTGEQVCGLNRLQSESYIKKSLREDSLGAAARQVGPSSQQSTPSNSFKVGKNELSLNFPGQRNTILLDKDDDTLVEIDGVDLEDDITPLHQATSYHSATIQQFKPAVSINQPVQANDIVVKPLVSLQVQANECTHTNTESQGDLTQKVDYCDDDYDYWITTNLKQIQEKIKRRKARSVYMVSSDDDTDVDSEPTLSSKVSLNWQAHVKSLNYVDDGRMAMLHELEPIETNVPMSKSSLEEPMNIFTVIQDQHDLTQDEATSTTGLPQRKSKKKQTQGKNLEDKMADNKSYKRHSETRPPSILRKPTLSFIANSCKKTGAFPSSFARMKPNVSVSHESKSSERVISFKDSLEKSKVWEKPVPAKRTWHGNYASHVTTWLEKQNFEASSFQNSPNLNHVPKLNFRGSTDKPADKMTSRHNIFSDTKREDSFSESDHRSNSLLLRPETSTYTAVSSKQHLINGKKHVDTSYNGDTILERLDKSQSFQRKQEFSKESVDKQVTLKEHKSSKINVGDQPNFINPCIQGERCDDKQHYLSKAIEKMEPNKSNHCLQKKKNSQTVDKSSQLQELDDSCVTFQLQVPVQKSKAQNSSKLLNTGVQRFYIPHDMWTKGQKAKIAVSVSPTHPDCQRVTTTAINTETGQVETLLDQTICTERLRTTIHID